MSGKNTKEYKRAAMRLWRERHPGRAKEHQDRFRKNNPDWAQRHKDSNKLWALVNPEQVKKNGKASNLRQYGLTIKQFEDLLAKQNGLCAICHRLKKLHVDHNHKTSAVRELLCSRCNRFLWALEDKEFFFAALVYLEKHEAKP